jgi:major vault protein
MSRKIVGILPNFYVHVLDLNSNITTVEVGPQNLVLQDNHTLEAGPFPFVTIPPGYYCIVDNPIDISKPIVDGKLYDLRFGHNEIRLHGEPFPLFPGESLPEAGSGKDYTKAIKKLPLVKADHAIHLQAIMDFDPDANGPGHKAGDEWQLRGPLTYIPRPEVVIVKMVSPIIVEPGHAVRVKARQDLTDSNGRDRCTGEEWLVREIGAYLPGVYEEVVEEVEAYTLTPKETLQLPK